MVNRSVTWATWDNELLALELQELSEADFDLSLTGFDDSELAHLLATGGAVEGLTDEDAVPQYQKARYQHPATFGHSVHTNCSWATRPTFRPSAG
jgi:hypothetical protein